MSLGTSFSTSGATPNQTSTPMFGTNAFAPKNAYGTVIGRGTPAGNALNSAYGSPTPTPALPQISSFATPLKSITVTHPDGTTVEQTSHTPVTPTTPTTSGVINSGTTTPTTTPPVTSPTTTPAPTAPAPVTPATSGATGTTFPGLINSASQAYKDAGNTNQIIGQMQNDAEHNSNYSLDTGLGISGQISRNLGLQGQNALTQAQGLSSLADKVAPQVSNYGQTAFNPLDSSFGSKGSGNLDPQTQATSLAQDVLSGKTTYDQALSSLAYAGNVGSNFLNSAITAAGGNPLQLQATGAANQSVIGTQTQQVEGYKSALQQGQNLQSQLSDLITTFGLNPSDINGANTGLQKIAANVSDPHYKQLENYVNDIANTYAQILTPPGGSATDTTRGIAASMIDATAKGTSIIDTMKGLDQQAQAKIAGTLTQTGSTGTNSVVQTTAGPVPVGW